MNNTNIKMLWATQCFRAIIFIASVLLLYVTYSTEFRMHTVQAASVSCTNAIHEADLTRSGQGSINGGANFDLGNCGTPASGSATSGAYENAKFLDLPAGKYRIDTTAQYGNSSDEHIIVLTSDGQAATILDLNGSNPGPVIVSGETTVDLCTASGSITIRAYSQIKPAAWDFQGISTTATRIGNATCGTPIGSMQCLVYGIAKAGTRDSQIFTYNPTTAAVTYGKNFDKLQLRGMAIHPVTNVIYVGAGVGSSDIEDSDIEDGVQGVPGGLYWINPTTLKPALLGATGMSSINGLAFRPTDKTLWAIAQKDGIYTIDLATMLSQKKLATSEDVDGAAWNAAGTLLYVKKDYHLYEYNPVTNTLTKIVSYTFADSANLLQTQGALGMRPDGHLLTPTSDGTGLLRYNPVTKSVVSTITITPDPMIVEGLDWPFMCPSAPPSPTPPPPPPTSDQNPSAINVPPSPNAGDNITFNADLTNQGTLASVPSSARFRMDINDDGTFDNIISTHAVGPIGPSDTVTITSGSWTAVVGTHRIEFCADINGTDPESNEGNNCRSQTFTVVLPATLSSNLTITPAQVLKGQKALVTWTSTNAITCTISGPGILITGLCSSVPNACNGSQQTPPINAPSNYSFQCTGSGAQTNSTSKTIQPVLPSFEER